MTNWMSRIGLILTLLLATLPALAQDVVEPDEMAKALALSPGEIPAGFQLEYELDHSLQAGTQSDYLALKQYYEAETPQGRVGVILIYAMLDSRSNASEAYRSFRVSYRPKRSNGIVGDATSGEYPFLSLYIVDKAVVYINIVPAVDFAGDISVIESLADSFSQRTLQKANQMGNAEASPLNVQQEVVSDRVSLNTDAEIVLTGTDSSVFPLSFQGTITSEAGEAVYFFEALESDVGSRSFTWSGVDASGNQVPPGNYLLGISSTDLLTRNVTTSVPITVEDTPTEPTARTLLTTQDSTLRAKKPNRNEGANPRLFLSHRLEARGKSQNPIIGFDLANEDLTGLTSATLVMNVQDCDLPRRWGNDGRFVIACPVNEPWVEGNGNKYRVQGGNGKTKGQGPGVTWFSPVDNKIQNNRPNGSVNWDGARTVSGPPTAPAVLLMNGQTGNIEFDVTQDVLAGFREGWVLKKQDETKFGNIRFYSKEGAAGDNGLTPRLILEFGSSFAKTKEVHDGGLLTKLGFGRGKLESKPTGSELLSFREQLQESPVAALAGETLVGAMAGPNPALKMVSQVAYRTWLGQGFG